MNEDTKEYYNENAKEFIESTFECNMKLQYEFFLRHINNNAKILDVGFGSARDLLYFKSHGYDVYGIDVVYEFVKNAKDKGLNNVYQMGVLDISYENFFDGIWCCASLLHLKSMELVKAFITLKKSLRKDGVIYASFKYGTFEGERNGRYFLDMTLEKIEPYLKDASLRVVDYYISSDVRKDRENEKWLNLILKV